MKPRLELLFLGVIPFFIIAFLSGCDSVSNHQGVMELVRSAETPVQQNTETVPVSPEPLVLVREQADGKRFYTRTRKDKMERFQCSSCHNGDKAAINEAKEVAHGNIILRHAAARTPDACDTCHNMQDRDLLNTGTGTKVDFDHSYQMCGTCHFRQKSDWIGGVHGKRIQNWEGTRAVFNCTGCHNPHSPRFTKRWPTTFSQPDPIAPAEKNSQTH